MDIHIQNRQERIWITVNPIHLDRGTNERLAKYQVGEIVYMEVLRIILEDLGQEPFDGGVVNGPWVEELEIDVDEVLCCHRSAVAVSAYP